MSDRTRQRGGVKRRRAGAGSLQDARQAARQLREPGLPQAGLPQAQRRCGGWWQVVHAWLRSCGRLRGDRLAQLPPAAPVVLSLHRLKRQ